eukprot:scaffold247491_cov48-Tisochrysis_lutea.AAC.1
MAFVALWISVRGDPTRTSDSSSTGSPLGVCTSRMDKSTAGSTPMIGGGRWPLLRSSMPFAQSLARKKWGHEATVKATAWSMLVSSDRRD